VIGRFSLAGGNPYVADEPEMVRGLGLLFKLPDGEEWRTAMINTAVFGVHTPRAFYDRLIATQPDPKTGKPDPKKVAAFLASHPETVQATKIIQSHSMSSGFANSTFYGLMPSGSRTPAEQRYPSAGRWCRCSRLHRRIRPNLPDQRKITYSMR
jgi:catalase